MSAAFDVARSTMIRFMEIHWPHKLAGFPHCWEDRVAAMRPVIDVFYMTVRAFQPAQVVETGVCLGNLTSLILAALRHNGHGHLTSVDLPIIMEELGMEKSATGVLVPESFRDCWTLIEGDAAAVLPDLLPKLRPGIFVHDSDHSYGHMAFEYAVANKSRAEVILSDDIMANTSFWDFTAGIGAIALAHRERPNIGGAVVPPTVIG